MGRPRQYGVGCRGFSTHWSIPRIRADQGLDRIAKCSFYDPTDGLSLLDQRIPVLCTINLILSPIRRAPDPCQDLTGRPTIHPKEENVFPFQEGEHRDEHQKYHHSHFRSQYCWANPGILAQTLWVYPDRDRACATPARRRVPG